MSTRFLVLSLFLATACASAGAPTAGSTDAKPSVVRRDRDVISADELSDPSLQAQSVYEVVRQLRPVFLSVRGARSATDPAAGEISASIDGNPLIALDELKRMHVNGVVEIRLLNPAAAMQKFGGAARQGSVILVRTM